MGNSAQPKNTREELSSQSLRAKARDVLRRSPTNFEGMTSDNVQRLVEELQIHQVELELQNEELRATQVELAETRDRLANLYDFAPVGYLTIDRVGYIREANLAATKLLQRERGELLGSPLTKYMSQPDADLLYKHLLTASESNSPKVCEIKLKLPDGQIRNVRLESVESKPEEPSLFRTVMSDITELIRAEEAAHRNARLAALGTLAAGIAHEVNNPLWMISLQAELALNVGDRPDRNDIINRSLREIVSLVERGGRIVNSVLRFARGDVSRKWPMPIASWLNHARDHARHRSSSKDVTVELEIPEGAPAVSVNPTEMEQVFVNLLTNAIEASNPSGRIRILVSWDTEMLTVRVEDEGCGMSEDELKRIFDPFYSTRRKTGGTGLGLSVSHRIIEDHHGSIEFTSKVGVGTTAIVRLPLNVEHTAQ